MNKTMTSFDIAAVTHEIDDLIKGSHIAKIYQIGIQTLLLKLRKPNLPRSQLIIESGKRIHLTVYKYETPQRPSSFCMSLRKFLDNGVIKSVKQLEFERIVKITINTRKGEYQLIIEFFGKGNIILIDPENHILQAMTYKRMRDRNILRGELFQLPPSKGSNPQKLTIQDFKEIKNLGEIEIVKALTKFLSIGGIYAEEILLRSNINKKIKCNSLTEQQLELIFIQLQKLLSLINTREMKACIVINKEKEWLDVTPISLIKNNQFDKINYETFNKALDEYYANLTNIVKEKQSSQELESEIARYKRILERQKEALNTLKEPIRKNKEIGDLIYSHFGDLNSLLEKIIKNRKNGRTWREIVSILQAGKKAKVHPDIYFNSLDISNQILYASIDNKIFSLNTRNSIQVNAKKYYEQSKKAEKKLEGAEKNLNETMIKIEKAKKQVTISKEKQKPLAKRRKKEWFEKFRWFHSSDGFLVIGGRDATSNEILIKKNMESHDIVFHADIIGAPFVLIKTQGEKVIPEQTYKEAGQLAASYSRAWKEMFSSMNVYWINPDQVSKTPPSGEFLKKGAFMIRGKKNFIRGISLKIAIGVKIDDEKIIVIGGPVEAIANQTKYFIKIIQGTHKSSQLAKKIRYLLSKKVSEELKRKITNIPLEEFQRFIPFGRGKIK